MNAYCLAIDPLTPATMYAGTSGGIFRSPDSGITWTAVNVGLTYPYVRSLAIDPATPSTLYAGTSGGIFRSPDSGTTWTAVNAGLTSSWVTSLAIDPLTPTTLYASSYGGVFRSTNSGTTWTAAGLTSWVVRSLAITPTMLYAATHGGGVFRSPDGGTTWTAVNAGLINTYLGALAIDPVTPTTLYATSLHVGTYYTGGVFRSTDSGDHWTAVSSGLSTLDISSVAINPATPSTLYAGSRGDGVFRSTHSSDHWTAVNVGLTNANVQCLAIDPLTPATMYAGTDGGGVFRYDAASYALTTTASPPAGGSIGRSPDALSYALGTVVTLTATPAPGYTFTSWSGDLLGTTNPTTITMTGNKTVTATFTPSSGTSFSLSLLPSWNVISVPFPTSVSLLPTCDLFLAWDGSLWQGVTALLPGTGYLVRNTGGATTVTLTGTPSSSPQTQPATGAWQIIGNPYTTPVSFTCTTSVPYLLFWDGSLWQSASPTDLPPGLGFLLQASSPGTITLTRLP
jgi:uncharacterized repeat protein (TIGR02543 family)